MSRAVPGSRQNSGVRHGKGDEEVVGERVVGAAPVRFGNPPPVEAESSRARRGLARPRPQKTHAIGHQRQFLAFHVRGWRPSPSVILGPGVES